MKGLRGVEGAHVAIEHAEELLNAAKILKGNSPEGASNKNVDSLIERLTTVVESLEPRCEGGRAMVDSDKLLEALKAWPQTRGWLTGVAARAGRLQLDLLLSSVLSSPSEALGLANDGALNSTCELLPNLYHNLGLSLAITASPE